MKEIDIMNCTSKTPLTWESIDWQKVNKEVENLQSRIFVASQEKYRRRLRRLQKLLLKSRSNILISIRKVLIQNKGRETPGIDRVIIAKSERIKFLHDIESINIKSYNPEPVKRVYIPKTDGKPRPLGIPTIKDRCIQAMVKNCLEPEWEAKFESTSYGFRPGRCPHDALSRIYNITSVKKHGVNKKQWILDADIEGFFNNVCHKDILSKLDNFPAKQLIEKWLRAGYMENNRLFPTEQGTPQGGIISPLLANIALYDLEEILKTKPDSTGRVRGSRVYIRYADDFVILCSSLEEARRTQIEISTWLKSKGLKIARNKTRIVHISQGFDFLGVNIKQYETNANSKTKNKVLLMQPSDKSMKNIRLKLKEQWHYLRSKPIDIVLKRLNPIIIGWTNYFRKYVATKQFRQLDNWMYLKCQNYASRMHPNKGKRWIYDNYFGNFISNRKDKWIFGDKSTGRYLNKAAWFNIQRHILVKGYNSPYDPKLKGYWETRNRYQFRIQHNKSDINIAEKQKFLCPVCNTSLYGEQNLAVHHLIPQEKIKIDSYWNLILVHQQCHQILHANKDLYRKLFNKFLPNPERMIKKNTKNSWKEAILSYVDNTGEVS